MTKLKVGDIVVGKDLCGYRFTGSITRIEKLFVEVTDGSKHRRMLLEDVKKERR